jgi:chemotaxis protein methyltransferase CheR
MLSNISLDEPTFMELRNFIYEKSGIYISDTKKYLLESRLGRIIQENKLGSFNEYLKHIKEGLNGNDLTTLFDAITTNETYFFREPQQLDIFINKIVPKILPQKKGKKKLKIWSAACSTGDEAYTISMMLNEKGIRPDSFEIYASDISEGVLMSAKNAIYNSYAVRNLPKQYLEKYFSPSGQFHELNETVKKTVKFIKANLIDDKHMKHFREMDVIFCRNVLIYFDNKSKQKTVSNLYNSLIKGGYLIIGSSESLHYITRAFRPSAFNKVVMYQKV